MLKYVNSFCKLLGHKWLYKDYSDWIKENGDNYDFSASRKCARCNQHEYLYDTWKEEERNFRYDIQHDAHSVKQLKNLQIH